MPVGFDSIRAGAAGGAADAYEIDYACRFNDNDSAYLYRTPGSAGNRRKWTLSLWVKRHNLGINQTILSANTGTNDHNALLFRSDDKLDFVMVAGGSVTGRIITTAVYRDVASWYHIVFQYDSANTTAGDRMKLFVNGDEVTSFSTDQNPSLNVQTYIASNVIHNFGRKYYVSSEYIDMSVSDVVFTDGELNNPSVFGEISSVTGQWTPIVLDGLSFGTTGYQFDFADASDLGNDVSGNNNDWTSSGLATNDQVTDTPTNNFCTWNPIYKPNRAGGLTNFDNTAYSDGNLRCTRISGSYNAIANGTMTVFGGSDAPKIYYEHTPTTWGGAIALYVGWEEAGKSILIEGSDNVPNYFYINGRHTTNAYESFQYPGGSTDNYATFGQGTVIGVAVDFANDVITYYANNTQLFSLDASGLAALSGITLATFAGRLWRPYSGFANDAGPPTTVTNFGQTPFTYTPPTGYVGLSTANLPDPAIPDPSAYFQPTLYTGNATGSRAITQDGNSTFGPDMVWIKNRDQADEWKALDTTRGATKELNLDSNAVESTDANGLTAFSGSDGFTLGTGAGGYNDNGEDFVAYQWEKGATPGFDIVSFTGTGSAHTESHSLSVVPDLIIVKERTNDTGQWAVYHSANTAAPETDVLYLNIPDGTADDIAIWNDTPPTSSVFTVGTHDDVNGNTDTYIAYLFAAVEGFSAFGSYVGNGSSDGPMINMGFKPKLWVTKPSGVVDNWMAFDTERNPNNDGLNKYLFLDTPGAEGVVSNRVFDLLSNGVKIRTSHGSSNQSGVRYIYMAWAETPFKTATAR